MKRGCLIFIVSLLASAGLAYYVFAPLHSSPGDWVAALSCGVLGAFSIGYFQNFLLHRSDMRALRESKGRMIPKDNQLIVAAGPIYPLRDGETLRTPFSDQEAILCQYEAYRMVTSGSGKNRSTQKRVAFSGLHLVPSAVRTGIGEVKLLCYPTMEGFPSHEAQSVDERERARKFRENTTFEELSIGKAFSMVKVMFTDDDGSIHHDYQNEPDAPIGDLTLSEEFIPAGAPVVVFGIYSAAKGGLIPSIGDTRGMCRLYKGDPASVEKKLRGKARGFLFGVFFTAALAVFLVPFILKQWEGSKDIVEQKRRVLFDAVQSNDLSPLAEILATGFSVDSPDSDQRTALMFATNIATAQFLLDHGANVNAVSIVGTNALFEAVASRNLELVRLLVDRGADLDYYHPSWHCTARGFAEERGATDIAHFLRKRGGKNIKGSS